MHSDDLLEVLDMLRPGEAVEVRFECGFSGPAVIVTALKEVFEGTERHDVRYRRMVPRLTLEKYKGGDLVDMEIQFGLVKIREAGRTGKL